MREIKNIERVVLEILQYDKRARKDDYYLYNKVLKKIVDTSQIVLSEFLENFSQFKAPSWKSVERCRRHIQELRTDLQDKKTAVEREEKQQDFKEYNLSGIGE